MKKIYICSALRGDYEKNIEKARCYSRYVAKEFGHIPITPHIYFTEFMNDEIPEEREFGIQAGLFLLLSCDELWYFGDSVTKGMTTEICTAIKNGIPIRYIEQKEYNNYLTERRIGYEME